MCHAAARSPPNGHRPRPGAPVRALTLGAAGDGPGQILAIGAHSDDIEIGCGGSLLRLIAEGAGCEVRWVVLSGGDERAREARASAAEFLGGETRAARRGSFRDGFFPCPGAAIKEFFEDGPRDFTPISSSPTPAATRTRITGSSPN